jgi:hypothetical protein
MHIKPNKNKQKTRSSGLAACSRSIENIVVDEGT